MAGGRRTACLSAAVLCTLMSLGCAGGPAQTERMGAPPSEASGPAPVATGTASVEPTPEAYAAACDSMTPQGGCYPRRVLVDACSGAERDPANEPEPATQCVCDRCADDTDCGLRPAGRCRQLASAEDVCQPSRRVCVYADDPCHDDDGCPSGQRCLHRAGAAVCAPSPEFPA